VTVGTVRLSDIAIGAQSGFASGEDNPDGVLQVRMNNVTTEGTWDWSKERRVPATPQQREKYALAPGDVLVNVTNSPSLVGKSATFPGRAEPVVFSNHFVRLRLDPVRAEPDYVRRWLNMQWQRHIFEGLCTQWVNQASVRKEDLLALRVPLPPLPEQRRIATILDKADAARRKRQQTLDLADQFLRAAFLDMFGDPVTNPKGWPVRSLGEVAAITTGNTPPRDRPEYYGSGIEWIKSDNINTPDHYVTPASERLSAEGGAVGRTAQPGATLMTCIAGSRSCIGNVAMADRDVAFNQQINALEPRSSVLPEFLYFELLLAKRLIQAASTDSMKGLVSKGRLARVKVPVPPAAMQELFSDLFRAVAGARRRLGADVEGCSALLESLVRQAFHGEA